MTPALLDVYCCEGGAAAGYAASGFEVFGVDVEPQPRYPFWFHQGDALDVLSRLVRGDGVMFARGSELRVMFLADFVAIHASPPCQAYSITRYSHGAQHPELIEPTRELLVLADLPYVIENVEGALPQLRDPMLLCGSMFGLKAVDVDGVRVALRRHRLFESNVWLMGAGGCAHDRDPVAGVYGCGRSDRPAAPEAGRGGYTPVKSVRAALMGMDWATLHGLSQAIPPAYSEFIGGQLLVAVRELAGAS